MRIKTNKEMKAYYTNSAIMAAARELQKLAGWHEAQFPIGAEGAAAIVKNGHEAARSWMETVAEKGEGPGAGMARAAADKLCEGRAAWLSDKQGWHIMMAAANAGLPLFSHEAKKNIA